MDSERYTLARYRSVELNPVRAGIVRQPSDYRWSSCRQHTQELSDFPISPHASWLALGADAVVRRRRNAELLAQGVTDGELEKIRRCRR